MRLEVWERRLQFKEPLTTAYATLQERAVLFLSLEDSEGRRGFGEAAPLKPFEGVGVGEVAAALAELQRQLAAVDAPGNLEELRWLLVALRNRSRQSHALAAVETALLDLAGQILGVPLYSLLAPVGGGRPVAVSGAIEGVSGEVAARKAAELIAAGYGTIKVKVGVGDDLERVAAVRSVAPGATIRLDANGAWSLAEAKERVGALLPFRPALCEEPVRGLEGIKALQRQLELPLIADESAPQDPGQLRGVGGICLRLGRCGGLLAAAAYGRAVQREGLLLYLSSTYEGPVGTAALLHLAVALQGSGPLAPCGIGNPWFEGVEGPQPKGGYLPPPAGPGLGAAPLA
jgi:L-alanine-DL-glutamate epimerase-like enolase superfamily enzyme